MSRYLVNVAVNGGRRASLLVVLPSSQPCSTLLNTVRSRLPNLATRLGSSDTTAVRIILHLTAEDGPLLDTSDLLSDVLPDSNGTIFAVIHNGQYDQSSAMNTDLPAQNAPTLQVRVITPESARLCCKLEDIAPLAEPVPLSCTLRELKGRVQESLGFSADDGLCPDVECSCSFARHIDSNATPSGQSTGYQGAIHNVIAVHSNSIVVGIPVEDLTMTSIRQAAQNHLSKYLVHKFLSFMGGVKDSSTRTPGNQRYLKGPVLALCSEQRHVDTDQQDSRSQQDWPSPRDLIVDIHNSECPIEITAHNSNINLTTAGLEDCAVNGVLNIFAVQRWTLPESPSGLHGKARIFKMSEAWEHYISQSDRASHIFCLHYVF